MRRKFVLIELANRIIIIKRFEHFYVPHQKLGVESFVYSILFRFWTPKRSIFWWSHQNRSGYMRILLYRANLLYLSGRPATPKTSFFLKRKWLVHFSSHAIFQTPRKTKRVLIGRQKEMCVQDFGCDSQVSVSFSVRCAAVHTS